MDDHFPGHEVAEQVDLDTAGLAAPTGPFAAKNVLRANQGQLGRRPDKTGAQSTLRNRDGLAFFTEQILQALPAAVRPGKQTGLVARVHQIQAVSGQLFFAAAVAIGGPPVDVEIQGAGQAIT